MKVSWQTTTTLLLIALLGVGYSFIRGNPSRTEAVAQTDTASIAPFDLQIGQNALRMLQEGRTTFRFDTFGDEAFWGDQLHLHQAIAGTSPENGPGPGSQGRCRCAACRAAGPAPTRAG